MPSKKGKKEIKKPGSAKEDADARPLQGTQRKYNTRFDKNSKGE